LREKNTEQSYVQAEKQRDMFAQLSLEEQKKELLGISEQTAKLLRNINNDDQEQDDTWTNFNNEINTQIKDIKGEKRSMSTTLDPKRGRHDSLAIALSKGNTPQLSKNTTPQNKRTPQLTGEKNSPAERSNSRPQSRQSVAPSQGKGPASRKSSAPRLTFRVLTDKEIQVPLLNKFIDYMIYGPN
jgi:hypothetical protein